MELEDRDPEDRNDLKRTTGEGTTLVHETYMETGSTGKVKTPTLLRNVTTGQVAYLSPSKVYDQVDNWDFCERRDRRNPETPQPQNPSITGTPHSS